MPQWAAKINFNRYVARSGRQVLRRLWQQAMSGGGSCGGAGNWDWKDKARIWSIKLTKWREFSSLFHPQTISWSQPHTRAVMLIYAFDFLRSRRHRLIFVITNRAFNWKRWPREKLESHFWIFPRWKNLCRDIAFFVFLYHFCLLWERAETLNWN